ncbi:hypothetical protein UFOVP135_55 [uncultured Caudovirales phage]|uniref:Uncharacterized protein n=1 Tax=uncultured Caudovirales phage TaxID=2100421 RepID=A0A6J5LDB9_9CAUD|nr:hypothetical protein UFOVP135_55 [uncultured Caudovirales phage]
MNNPPAFPVQSIYIEDQETNSTGMTLRDYFAAKAMQGEMTQGIHEVDFAETAARSYAMADAMLKARETNGL